MNVWGGLTLGSGIIVAAVMAHDCAQQFVDYQDLYEARIAARAADYRKWCDRQGGFYMPDHWIGTCQLPPAQVVR